MKTFPKHLLSLLIMMAAPFALCAQFSLTGTVTDAANNPLLGASVKLKNSNDVGVTTNATGKFSLRVPGKNGVVEISFVGFVTQSFSVDDNT